MADVDFETIVSDTEREIQSKLTANNREGALRAAVANPPVACKDQALKDRYATAVLSALTTCSDSEVTNICDTWEVASLDILLKYVYRGLATAENPPLLLKWHAKIVAKAGVGSIVRAMTERKTV